MSENAGNDEPTIVLTEEQCWERLASRKVGRLVTVVGGRPEIYPVNYVTKSGKLYFRSGEGSKLSELSVQPLVAFEVDEIHEDSAWSVVIHGHAHILHGFDDEAKIDALGLDPWVPSPKFNYVEVTATEVTGMKYRLVKH